MRKGVLWFENGSGHEGSPRLGSGRQFLGSFLSASEKRDWTVNNNAVEIKLAVAYQIDFAFGR